MNKGKNTQIKEIYSIWFDKSEERDDICTEAESLIEKLETASSADATVLDNKIQALLKKGKILEKEIDELAKQITELQNQNKA